MGGEWNYGFKDAFNKRKSKRRNWALSAEIARVEDGKHLAACRVLDISEGGARLGLNSTDDLPDEFVLILSRVGKVFRRCNVVRASKTELGVSFVGAQAAK